MRARLWFLLVPFLGLSLAASSASAFCRTTTCTGTKCEKDEKDCNITGAKVFWPTKCVSFNFQRNGTQDLDPAETKVVVAKSFQHWAEVPCPDGSTATMTFVPGDDVYTKRPEYNKDGPNVNVIFFRDDDWPYKGIDGTLATTSVSFDKTTGEIWDADIAVNSAFNTVTLSDKKIEYDLESIMVHEAGHFIGIAHSDDPFSIMAPTYNPGSTNRKLTEDDVAAICAAYPASRNVPCNSVPRGGFADADAPGASSGICTTTPGRSAGALGVPALGTFSLLAALLLYRRRRSS
jgi:hypothetical protein